MARSLFKPGKIPDLRGHPRQTSPWNAIKVEHGELLNLTGMISPYEAPDSPELMVDMLSCRADDETADNVINELLSHERAN